VHSDGVQVALYVAVGERCGYESLYLIFLARRLNAIEMHNFLGD
jgi:hypothetical protein